MTELEKLQHDLAILHTLILDEIRACDKLLNTKHSTARDLELAKHLHDIQRYSAMTTEV
jgi:hypothetical protein